MSKFKGIFDSAKDRDDSNVQLNKKVESQVELKTKNKSGRPRGKRSNPDYEQVTAYIKRETYKQTKIALLQQEKIDDFSELIEQLLNEWLNTRTSE